MKKLIPLILLTTLVGCAEYDDFRECIVKERQKIQGEASVGDRNDIKDYCRTLKYN